LNQAASGEVLRILLARRGAGASALDPEFLQRQLFLGIDALDAAHVQVALEAGADPNCRAKKSVTYTPRVIGWDVQGSPVHSKHAAVPLQSALFYRGYTQMPKGPSDEDRREAVVRLLLQKGADAMAWIKQASLDDKEEDEEENEDSETSKTDSKTPRGIPLLHSMLESNGLEGKYLEIVLQHVVDRGLDLEFRDRTGRTPFLAACDANVCWMPNSIHDTFWVESRYRY
jgi:hypothetical protein